MSGTVISGEKNQIVPGPDSLVKIQEKRSDILVQSQVFILHFNRIGGIVMPHIVCPGNAQTQKIGILPFSKTITLYRCLCRVKTVCISSGHPPQVSKVTS